ncbi:phosphate ABC transporter substrate-binding protein [Thiohalophilus sp.]|uniref:PstS family phosphate ABC transporter substrate-binding protein n=1 Tax=Thiohalophilus sp. TaxID=3028392 RepID=UPI002ACDB461|nr:phosphate ABC transporter substrate-binding protein [Thiohalophilus sp.]MDZ7663629.1 phosphate ABC transporter substrate-binding protein [Thiohalophilus sp.]
MFKKKQLLASLLALSFVSGQAFAQAKVDSNLPDYQSASGVSGNFSSIGSDTMNNLMTLWAEDYAKFYPNVNIQIQGAGSSTAPPALAQGTANFGPMSRQMKGKEVEAFEKKFGYPPTPVATAIDVLAVYVNKDNPIKSMSIPQVDAVFSATRRCGYKEDITRWGQLGMTGAWASRDMTLYSRNAVSGTYGYFKKHALCDGDYKASINEQPGSASVVQGVTESLNGIGYSGIGYITSGVRAVPLAEKDGNPAYGATPENAANGKYPLARMLYVYVNKKPGQPLPPLEREFFKMVLSKQGQETVIRDGYIPLPAAVAERERKKLGIE